ncbi:MAG TPA: hypothetical protein VL915_05125 [Gemmatimonadales bacterium]|jgi:hypothetical protein|nr:hypothetical protein [Gemmatimonadales bacterium]
MRLPLFMAGVAIYFAGRFLSGRRQRNVVRLRNGRRIKLLSSVALLDGSDGNLLALEYVSELRDPTPDALRFEARNLVQTVAARAEYATCRSALVSVGRVTFTFLRGDSGSNWYPAEAPE